LTDGPITYEVNLVPDPAIEDEFDEWLDAHVADMLRLPGFLTAVVRRAEDPATGVVQRTCQYELTDQHALDRYVREHAATMRQHGLDRFGDRFTATRRVLDRGHRLSAVSSASACANCEAPLNGQYCALCGQRARARMITVWQLLREVSEVLTTLDSRLWRTLTSLLFRPGRVTADYLKGRRVRYAPPLRMFLGASLVFFFAVAIGDRFDLGDDVTVTVGDDQTTIIKDAETPPETVPAPGDGKGAREAVIDAVRALEDESEQADHSFRFTIGDDDEEADASTKAESSTADATTGEETESEDPCADIEISLSDDMNLARDFLNEIRVTAICRKIVDDHGASFGRALLDNIPIMMFLFLPLMAAVMKLLYVFTGRYYVEHLLFLVHYHAFFYLLLSLALISGWIFDGVTAPEWPSTLLGIATSIYVPFYLYRAMRVVYQQGRGLTLVKYFSLGFAYFMALIVMFTITAALTAFTL